MATTFVTGWLQNASFSLESAITVEADKLACPAIHQHRPGLSASVNSRRPQLTGKLSPTVRIFDD